MIDRKRGTSGSTYHWAMGALALVGVVLGVLGVTGSSRPDAGVADAAPPPASPQERGFPAQLDSLGVSIGPAEAPVVVREFADYQCPACGEFSHAMKALREEYVSRGQVRFVFFDIPLTTVHPNAVHAAEAARCAGQQERYWAMHDELFENQPEWSSEADPLELFARYAQRIGADAAEFRRCMASDRTLAAVQRSAAMAAQIGVRSTPTFLVDNAAFAGSVPYDQVRQLVEERLALRSGLQ